MDILEIDRRVEAGETLSFPAVCFKEFLAEVERHVPQSRRWMIVPGRNVFSVSLANKPGEDG